MAVQESGLPLWPTTTSASTWNARASVIQLPEESYSEEGAQRCRGLLDETGVRATATTIAHDGEQHGDWPTARRTVGYVPQEFRSARVAYSHKVIGLTAAIGCRYVTTHIGEPPHDPRDSDYAALVDIVRELAHHCAELRSRLGLERGQESRHAMGCGPRSRSHWAQKHCQVAESQGVRLCPHAGRVGLRRPGHHVDARQRQDFPGGVSGTGRAVGHETLS
jgi:sugar phosphate isomerase/epimerase